MYCRNCGAQIPDDAAFCANCGFQLKQEQQTTQQPSYQQSEPTYQQPDSTYQQPTYSQYTQPVQQQGMKWHKFLVYFSLWLGALANFGNGIKCMTGMHYGESKDLVYRVIPELKTPDLLFGLCCIAVGILGICTAVNLLKYKALGPKLLNWTYIFGASSSLIYCIVTSSILSKYHADLSSIYTSAGSGLIVAVVMVIVNSNYYKKRAHLFVN